MKIDGNRMKYIRTILKNCSFWLTALVTMKSHLEIHVYICLCIILLLGGCNLQSWKWG